MIVIDDVGDDWPRNKRGEHKLFLHDSEADRLIAAGALEEDDIVRLKPLPAPPGSISVFQSARRVGKSLSNELLEMYRERAQMTPDEFRRQFEQQWPPCEEPK